MNCFMYRSGICLCTKVHNKSYTRREDIFLYKNYQGNCLLSSFNKLVIELFFQKNTCRHPIQDRNSSSTEHTHLTKRSMESSSSYPNTHLHLKEEFSNSYCGTSLKLLNGILYIHVVVLFGNIGYI